jgi:diguanylate cyclase (GGDEF)-like protein/PAS domain S-box-containing protein
MKLATPLPLSVRKNKRGDMQYRSLLEAAPDAIVVVNPSGTIVLVNTQAERLFGYRRDELIGQPTEILVPQRFRGQHSEHHSRFLAPGLERPLLAGLELFGLHKDGSEFPVEIRLSPLDTKQGILVCSAIRDITDRRSTEEDLRRLASIVACSDDAIISKTLEGIITSWSAGAERMYGYSAKETIGKSVSMLVPIDPRGEIPEVPERLKRSETVDHFETVGIRKDGKEFHIEITTSPIRDVLERIVGASTIGRDISVRKAAEEHLVQTESNRRIAEEALRESEERYQILLDGVQDHAIFMMDSRGQILSWNAGAERIKGYKAEEIIGHNFSCFFPPEDIESGRPEEVLRITAACGRHEEQGMRVRKNGSRFLASVTFSALRDAAGNLRGFSEFSHDLSASKESEAKYRGLLEAAPDAMVVVNQGGEIVLLNIQAEKQFGYRRDELVGQKMKTIIPEGFAERLVADGTRSAEEALAQQIGTGIELTGRRKDGSNFPIEIMLSPLKSAEGILVTAAIRNVSVARAMSLQITHLAEHDFLTGLPNRTLVNDRIIQAIAGAQRHGKKVAVLFLDLDGFKHINDSLGHPIGDKLLQSIANRLVTCVRGSDTISRQGGDEFVMLLLDVNRPEDAGITARRMLEVVAGPHSIDQHDLHITASIGVSIYPDDGLDADTLIKNADTAMYQAKENGRQSYQFFKSAMNVRAVERQSIEESLRRALERQEFTLRYQPKVNLRTGQITGAEALLRWTHPVRGQVPPGQFIGVAEACGLILPIGNWVLREACKQAQAWADAGLRLGSMAVNISALEFGDEKFLEKVFAILEETRLEPRFLELELTESVLMKRAESTEFILLTLRGREVQLAVDDFGTGYSSLSYLTKFPIDALKIDQSFIRQITATPDDTAIVTAVISMGRSLNLRVVAEGVETKEELAFLQSHHCDEAQGYLFGRPLPPEEFSRLLETGISESVLAPSTILGSALV